MDSLCRSCSNVRQVVTGTGSKFLLCRLSQTNERYPKYPPQPVVRCDGYEDQRSATSFNIEVLPDVYAISRLNADAAVPDWVSGEFVSITRSSDELSIVCPQGNVPASVRCERPWRCLRIGEQLGFSMIGVISSLAGNLAAANISVFVISTFDTDYFLVREEDLAAAVRSLVEAGNSIQSLP